MFQLPEQYRFMSQMPTKKKHKHKRKRESGTNGALQEATGSYALSFTVMLIPLNILACITSFTRGIVKY